MKGQPLRTVPTVNLNVDWDDQKELAKKVEEALVYLDFLEQSARRLKEIIHG